MAQFFGDRMGAPFGPDHHHLIAWRNRMTQRPAVQTVIAPMAEFLRMRGKPVPDWLRDNGHPH
jgi:glutathione S-transferase